MGKRGGGFVGIGKKKWKMAGYICGRWLFCFTNTTYTHIKGRTYGDCPSLLNSNGFAHVSSNSRAHESLSLAAA
jgi:hypothetical protein